MVIEMGVVDAKRLHHPEERVFTGPQPRKNGLDYILMSESLFSHIFKDSTYFNPIHGGDHLAHSVTFVSPSQLRGRGYLKCPMFLFEYPDIVEAIKNKSKTILSQL